MPETSKKAPSPPILPPATPAEESLAVFASMVLDLIIKLAPPDLRPLLTKKREERTAESGSIWQLAGPMLRPLAAIAEQGEAGRTAAFNALKSYIQQLEQDDPELFEQLQSQLRSVAAHIEAGEAHQQAAVGPDGCYPSDTGERAAADNHQTDTPRQD